MTTLTLTNDDAEWVEALIEQRNAYALALNNIRFKCWDDKLGVMEALTEIAELANNALENNPDPIAPTVA